MSRDCAVTASLLAEGWTVLHFWESEVKKSLGNCVDLALEAAMEYSVLGNKNVFAVALIIL